jgi:hypothetical protein
MLRDNFQYLAPEKFAQMGEGTIELSYASKPVEILAE